MYYMINELDTVPGLSVFMKRTIFSNVLIWQRLLILTRKFKLSEAACHLTSLGLKTQEGLNVFSTLFGKVEGS